MNLNKYLIAQSLQYLQWLEFNSWEISWWVMQTSIECHLLPQVSQDFFHAEHCLFLTFPISILMLENNMLDSSFIFMHLLDRMIAIVIHRCYLGDFISVLIFIILLTCQTCSSWSWSSLTDVTSSASSSKVSFSAADAPWNCLHFNSLL